MSNHALEYENRAAEELRSKWFGEASKFLKKIRHDAAVDRTVYFIDFETKKLVKAVTPLKTEDGKYV